jgi:FKBP-type peptidyl-prolyl cis-trans isomerase (trigger factor)
MLQQRENQKNIELGNKVLDKIIEESKVEWPLAFEEQNVEQEIQRQERQMTAYGLTMESFLQMQGKTSEAFSQETREEVVNRLQRGLVIGKVAEQEKLEISESEILEQAKLIADISGRGDQFWRDILASEAQQSMIANDLLINKTVERLAEIAKGEDPPIGLDNGSDEATQQAEADADSAVTAADESAEESEPSAAPADEDQDVSEDESAEEPAPTQA